MRVLYILYRFPQLSQTFVRDEIVALRADGIHVDVISLDDPGLPRPSDAWAGPYRVASRPTLLRAIIDLVWWFTRAPAAAAHLMAIAVLERRRARYMLVRVPTLARRLTRGNHQHVHTHFAWDTASVASAVSRLLGTTSSITVHARDIYAQPPRIVRRRLSRYSTVITVCHFNVGWLRGARMVDANRPPVSMIPCGVEVPPRVTEAKQFDVVAVGRLIEKKGMHILIEAVGQLQPHLPELRVAIVGDGPLAPALRALVADLGLKDSITMLGGLPHEDTLRTIGAGRVFCMPAIVGSDGDSDAMPVVIREAMARGIPVVASAVAGIPEAVQPDVGWTVPPGSVPALADALISALTGTEQAVARGERARERCAQLWTFGQQARSLRELFAAAE